nr:hypothetical protein [Candidatus Sigynarchaeota archaeon]
MTTSDTPTSAPDITERMLAAIKGLKDNFDKHYAEIESRVKKSIEGPVKTFTIDDDIPIVLQLSVWDAKLGPVTAMLVGETKFIGTIPVAEQDNSTRMMDVLVPGETCDLSKGNVSRLMIKFAITDPGLRGGEAWLLVVVYYDTAVSIPKIIIDDMLKEMARCWRDDAALSVEAMGIRDHFSVATSRWKEYLMELRRSIWSLVARARDIEPAKPGVVFDVPDVANVVKEPLTPAIPSVDDVTKEPDGDEGTTPAVDPLDVITNAPALEPVKIMMKPSRPEDEPVTPGLKKPAIVPPKILLQPVESQVVDVLGKLQRSGFTVKVDKGTREATACRLVELDPGKPGLVALILSFHARFLPFPALHVIDGKFYAGDERVLIEPYRPAIKDIVAKHVPGSEELVYRKKAIGRVYKERPLKPILVPLVLVRDSIRDGTTKIPFCWIEPDTSTGIHGHFVLAAGEIDHLDKFLMNALRVLGGKAVMAEATHVDEVVKDITATSKTGRALAFLTTVVGIIGLLGIMRVLPVDATILLQQYWYVQAVIAVALVGGIASTYNKLAKRVERRVSSRVSEVAPRTPLLVKPTWDDLIDAARRVGKVDFPAFRLAFCQDLDATAIDEAVDVVFKQDTATARPGAKKVADTFTDLESSVPATDPKVKPANSEASAASPVTLRVREMGKRRRPVQDDDILADTGDEVDTVETPTTPPIDPDEGAADKIDPLEALSHRD